MVRILRIAIASALLLAAGNAWALGLGQIEVKSRRNQPLLAEIPIISTTPGELEALQARLASPETFRRIGLAPPTGAAADLQFSLGSDARGRPVIRVTTLRPVDQPVLNFLIEVDWGQGRLVREYAALVDAPTAASAPVAPAIQAPQVTSPNVVQRPAAPVPDPEPPLLPPRPIPPPVMPVPPTPVPPPPPPVPAPVPQAPAPGAIAVPPPPAVPAANAVPAAPAQYGPVRPGETLSKIAAGLDLPDGYSLDQAMLALLRANPDAFLAQDINRLKRGAVLRVPGGDELARIPADEAALVVRQQMQQWREQRRAVAQPAALAAAATPAAAPATTRAPDPGREQARLQIVPPSAPGRATATRSGTSAGGEGSMLQQQLRQKDEDIAAKSAEIGELKERLVELEQLREQQQQLIALKDSELAAAQQRLAASNAAPAPTATASTQASPPARDDGVGGLPWMWGVLAVLGMALLAWLFVRRQRPVPVPVRAKRRGFDSEALAASMRAPATGPAAAGDHSLATPPADPDEGRAGVGDDTARVEAPGWHSGRWVNNGPAEVLPAAASPRFVPDQEPAAPATAAHRLKLAAAFLDIGDDHSARQLLRELLDDRDPVARSEAARLLRELD